MKNKKIILSSILALGVLGGVVGVVNGSIGAEAATIAAGTKLYLKPHANWTQANARFAIYFYGNGDAWVSMSDTDGDGIYEATSPSSKTYTNLIFCRMNPSASANNWNNKWNQTGDLTWPGSSSDLYTLTSGEWDAVKGSWSKYTYVAPTVSLMGTMTDWGTGQKMTESNGIYTTSVEADAMEYSIKVKNNDTWLGHANLTVNGITVTNDADDNIVFTAIKGTYTFTFNIKTNVLDVTVEPAANPDEDVVELFSTYYNGGTYTKETTLYTNKLADEELATHFHAGAQTKHRKTTYAPGELTMVTKENDGDAWGTRTSTYKDNNEGGVDHLTNGEFDYHVSGKVNGQDRSSVENWYVTLYDFVNTELTGWEYADGVYSLSLKNNAVARKMAIEFVAPMFLDNENTNYVTYDKLTVEEVDDSLVMKIHLVKDSEGLLTGEEGLVLSKAVITK